MNTKNVSWSHNFCMSIEDEDAFGLLVIDSLHLNEKW